ncbi:MAG: response regulator [Desulfoprunum sp.]|nr:response regulator [Desulfoprunum sp.]
MKETLHILLIEDNPGDAELMRVILEDIADPQYLIRNVQRLAVALEVVRRDHFDIIILDLGLPDSSGLATLRAVIQAAPELPVVVLTGMLDEQIGLDAVKAGAQDFLIKGQIGAQLLIRVLRYAYERNQSEIDLRNSELQTRTILDAIDNQILLMGTDYRIKWPNMKACEAAGLAREQIVGKFCYELWPRQTEMCTDCPVEKAIATGEYQFEHRRTKIGKTWDIKACPVRDQSGAITSIVELRNDISEQVLLEEQFFQAQKMEAVGRLAGGVAHDFNNMLSVILGCGELAKELAPKEGQLREYIDEILNAGVRSAALVRQLLAFSRKQTINPQIVDCNAVIENSQKMLKRLIGEDIEFHFIPAADLWTVMIDPSQLDQILANLTVNARDAILGNGVLAVETANVVLDEYYCATHVYAKPGNYVCLSLSDTGSGMSKEVMAQIFEPFFTTKKVGQGTGLGMSTIFGIVKQNNGHINVYSEVGVGTTVKVYLPSSDGEALQKIEQKSIENFAGDETILVVEDDPAILYLCRTILTGYGYTVITEIDPRMAIEHTLQKGDGIALLLSDVIMPHMNGEELRLALEKHLPAIKTIFMTGNTADIIAHQGIMPSGINFLQKPFTKEQLAQRVREVLDS